MSHEEKDSLEKEVVTVENEAAAKARIVARIEVREREKKKRLAAKKRAARIAENEAAAKARIAARIEDRKTMAEKRIALRIAKKKRIADKREKRKEKERAQSAFTREANLKKRELSKSKADAEKEALRKKREKLLAAKASVVAEKKKALEAIASEPIEVVVEKRLQRTPSEAYGWGNRVSIKIAEKAGKAAAEEFVKKLRSRWGISRAVVDKKAYDGAKNGLSKNILLAPKAGRLSSGVYSGVTFSVEEACTTIDYINRINKNVLRIELGLSGRAVDGINAARPLDGIEDLAALPHVGESTLFILRNEANYWLTIDPEENALQKRNLQKRKEKERTASEAFSWGRLMAEQILEEEGATAVKEFVTKLRKKWNVSKSIVDKKAYDGAKKSAYIPKKTRSNCIIKYSRVSGSLFGTFGISFLKKYGLKNLDAMGRARQDMPAVYFGCYKQEDVNKIRDNRSDFKIVVYGGTDATRRGILRQLRGIPNLHHVAISKYIANDLKAMRIKYKEVAITPIDHGPLNIKPEPLGRSVYIYNCSEAKAKQYGSKLYKEVVRRINKSNKDIKFEICGHRTHSREELMEVYKRSFIGLRLLEHDGLPNTVIELGLMGRRTVHNGGLPSGIPYSNVDDICESIIKEFERAGQTDYEVAKSTLEHLENSRKWLKKSYWEET